MLTKQLMEGTANETMPCIILFRVMRLVPNENVHGVIFNVS
jgi:hypothetical protein